MPGFFASIKISSSFSDAEINLLPLFAYTYTCTLKERCGVVVLRYACAYKLSRSINIITAEKKRHVYHNEDVDLDQHQAESEANTKTSKPEYEDKRRIDSKE